MHDVHGSGGWEEERAGGERRGERLDRAVWDSGAERARAGIVQL